MLLWEEQVKKWIWMRFFFLNACALFEASTIIIILALLFFFNSRGFFCL